MSEGENIPAFLTYLVMVLPAVVLFFLRKIRWSKHKQRAQTVNAVLGIVTVFSLIEIVRRLGDMFPKEHLLWSFVAGGTACIIVALLGDSKKRN